MKRQGQSQQRASRSPGLVPGGGRLYPLFFRLGPVALSICSVLLISLLAVLYLSQLSQAVTTNQQIQDLRSRQTELQRQNNDLVNTIASEQSPAYIAAHASAQGLSPVNSQNIQVIVVPNVQTQQNGDQSSQP